MADSTHQLTFPHELGRGSADLSRGDLGAVQEYVMNSFGGADGSRHGHLLHATIRSGADFDTGRSDVGQHERPELRELGEKACSGHSTSDFEICHEILLIPGNLSSIGTSVDAVGMTRVKSHVIRAQNASKLSENA